MHEIKALLFDVDGTLLDTKEFIYQAFEHTIVSHSHTPQTRAEIDVVMGKSLEDCYTFLTGCEDIPHHVETHRSFQEQNLHLSTPYPNTISTLQRLREYGLKMAVLTTRSKRTSLNTLKNAGIHDLFDLIISGEDVQNLKPHPEPLLKALEQFGLSPSEAAMVGDTAADVLAGKNAGTKTVAVTYGFGGEKIKEQQPDFVLDDIAELLDILEK